MIISVLAWLFPPRLKGRWVAPEVAGEPPEVPESGIVWVAYDVKMTGIERMAMLDREANFHERHAY